MLYMRVICLVMMLTMVCRAQEPAPEKIEQAIAKGVAGIYALQNDEGHWESQPPPAGKVEANNNANEGQWGGTTAMALYALLSCGEKPNDPKLAKAIDLLHTKPITGTYAVALKCLVWLHLPQTPEVKKSLNRDARLLASMSNRHSTGVPVWDYGPVTGKFTYSLSRTQYATLGLWAAGEIGYEMNIDAWRALEKTWELGQQPDGGWKYRLPADLKGGALDHITVCMTAAAIASLYITQDYTKGDYYAGARGNATSIPIEKGLEWLAKNFKERVAVDKEFPREFPYAQLYALERVGLASGLRRFGDNDWYAVGSTWLLKKQTSKGTWSESWGPLPNTAWALLFLQRGRTPVAFSKLDYSNAITETKNALWNQRPRDVANVTQWLTRSLERELRWQIVRTDAGLASLLESPILYLSGDQAIEFKPEDKKLLKEYIENGGLMLAHADVSKDAFSRSIMSLGTDLFPSYEWRELPETHPIWTNQNYKREAMKGRVSIKALSNGVRELMILLPTGDLARVWQLRNSNQRTEAWETAANILSYATDKTTFYSRGYSWLVDDTATPTTKTTKTVTVGQLKYPGNWNPEPQALAQLSKYAKTKGVEIKSQAIEMGQPIENINLLLINGTVEFQFDDPARKAIADYAEKGGTVLFENSGGLGGFVTSAESEISKIFGQNINLIPAKHPMYGTDLKIEYRPFNIMSIGNLSGPAIRGIEKDGRVIAMLSREDLSAGWLGIPTDGIVGYKPASARALMTQILSSLKK